MKKYLYLLLLCNSVLYSQEPQGYYDNATGTGYTLKTQLYTIIAPHTTLAYGAGLWNLFTTSDVRPDNYVWEIYSNCNFIFGTVASGGNQDDGTLGTIECQRFNKEHTFPKSWFGGQIYPMYSDAFIVMPSDKKDNGLRGSLVYANVNATVTNPIGNGWRIGSCVTPNYSYNLDVFEPADQFKGDFARNYFYVATCYENQIAGWQNLDPNGNTVLDGTSDKVFEQWYLEMLYSWHVNDPVSSKETTRNNAIFAAQGNRNPFVDHPEYVDMIWGDALRTATYSTLSKVRVYPNPSTDGTLTLSSEQALDEIELITVNGQIVQKIAHPEFQNNTYTLFNLPKGFYFLQLKGAKETLTKKVILN